VLNKWHGFVSVFAMEPYLESSNRHQIVWVYSGEPEAGSGGVKHNKLLTFFNDFNGKLHFPTFWPEIWHVCSYLFKTPNDRFCFPNSYLNGLYQRF